MPKKAKRGRDPSGSKSAGAAARHPSHDGNTTVRREEREMREHYSRLVPVPILPKKR